MNTGIFEILLLALFRSADSNSCCCFSCSSLVPLYLALIVGILILRQREPQAERPYRALARVSVSRPYVSVRNYTLKRFENNLAAKEKPAVRKLTAGFLFVMQSAAYQFLR